MIGRKQIKVNRYLPAAVLCCLLITWFGHYAQAKKVFTYRDKRGVIHFTDAPTDKRYRVYKLYAYRGFRSIQRYRTDVAAYVPFITAAAQRYSLEPALIKAVIKAESAFDPKAVSIAGAKGLMQLMPNTAQEMKVSDVFDPRQNIFGGSKYLRLLLDRYKGDLTLALAAYNLGPAQIQIGKSIPYVRETRQYVKRVKRFYQDFSK